MSDDIVEFCLCVGICCVKKMVRYLIHFQYLGTKYCGVVRASQQTKSTTGKVGVQDIIENALERLNPYRPTKILVSSRTDSGVHALCNAAHFDLVRAPHRSEVFKAESLRYGLNSYIGRDEPIRIIGARRVPDSFHSQHRAIGRSYLYRLATGCTHRTLPITEMDRCWAVNHELNVDAMKEASRIFLGTHDFSAFRSSSSENSYKSPIRTIGTIEILPSQSNFFSLHWGCQGMTGEIKFLEVVFRSRSFLYKQMRRMVSALVSVGTGQLSLEELQEVLDSRDNTHRKISSMAPPGGLYLGEVLYNEQDLQLEDSDQPKSPENEQPNS